MTLMPVYLCNTSVRFVSSLSTMLLADLSAVAGLTDISFSYEVESVGIIMFIIVQQDKVFGCTYAVQYILALQYGVGYIRDLSTY